MIKYIIIIVLLFSLNINAQDKGIWVDKLKSSKDVKFNDVETEFEKSDKKWFKHYERWAWNNRLDIDEKGNVNNRNTSLTQYQDVYLNNQKSTNNYGNWSPLGPTNWINGNSGYNPGNGRVNAITVDPNNSDIIYACAASGGLWKTNDGGQSWNALTDDFPVLGTSDVEINPLNTEIIYLGTGDRDGLNTYGVGVYKSIDGGATWNPTGLFDAEPELSLIVNCLEINPINPNIIFAGTKSGLKRSVDGGDNWESIIPFGDFMEIKFNPENPNTVYAARDDKFYRSTNGGTSFQTIWDFPTLNVGRIAFDVSKADTAYIYALISDINADFMGVYRSTDGGLTFTEMVNGDEINLLGYANDGSDDGSQAWYDLAIAASPTNRDEVYTGGINVWGSINGGTDWSINTKWYYSGDNSVYSHADIHSLDFYGNTLYCGSDGGVFKNSSNNGWQNISTGLNITQIYRMSNSYNGSTVSVGTQDNGTNVFNSTWKHIRGADGMETIIDYSNPNIVYCSIYYASIYKSNSGGDNSSNIFSAEDKGETAAWVAPYIIDEINNSTLYVGAENIYKTTNSGAYWTKITDLNNDTYFDYIAIAPSNSNYIYAARSDMFIRTTDGGFSWDNINIPTGGTVTGIEISSSNPERVFVSTSSNSTGYVIYSPDACESFTISYPAIYSGVNNIAYENNTENGIYAATNFGILYINDNLTDWVDYSQNMPTVKVTELDIVENINKLRASTYGRGVWESGLYSETVDVESVNNIFSNFIVYPNPVETMLSLDFGDLDVSKFYIYNSAGLGVYLLDNVDSKLTIDVSSYVEGSYFVKVITTDKKEIVQKFLKQ